VTATFAEGHQIDAERAARVFGSLHRQDAFPQRGG
jgi:hypothetical protein